MLLRFPWGESDELTINSAYIAAVHFSKQNREVKIDIVGDELKYKIDYTKENIEIIKTLYEKDINFFGVKKLNDGYPDFFIGRKECMISYSANQIIYSNTSKSSVIKFEVEEGLIELDDIFIHGKQHNIDLDAKSLLKPIILERKKTKYVY